MKYLTIILCGFALSGCANLLSLEGRAIDETVDALVEGTDAWCDNTDQAFRDKVREQANAKLAPRSVAADCAE